MTESNAYQPYAPNAKGLTEALLDFKNTITGSQPPPFVGLRYETFESVTQGSAVYLRSSDAKVGLAVANDTFDKADVLGLARTSKSAGQIVEIIVVGILATTGLDPGDIYYLSATTPVAVTATAPSAAGLYVTRIGEAASTTQLCIQLEQPILLK